MFWKQRIQQHHIHFFINLARHRFPNQPIAVLHDGAIEDTSAPEMQGVLAIDCGATQIDALSAPKFKDLIFVYACSWNSNGLPWIREIISQEGRYISCLAGEPGRWIVSNHVARTVMDFEFERQNTEQYAKWDWPDFVELCQAIHRTKHIPGDFVEVGCFEGSSSSVALHFMKESRIGRNCWMLDVFDGFNYATADLSPDAVWKGGHVVAGGREIVEQRLKRYEAADIGLNVNVVRSDITKDELPAAIKKIALASIDVDMYEAVLAALRKVRPLLSIGGIVLVEDPPHTPGLIGAALAVDEFMESPMGQGLFRYDLPCCQTLLLNMG